ncbi:MULTISPECIES: DUF1206 domain-containing protein [unclassified Cryobacterium]|uniref:DUF1206 domain-containing protein n=1 Tax=unclassified Cryobacterium TaxID=2649013 RepID=UPI001F547354|nr:MULTISPECIES: DUF1206 domain-containing protein [unclassified Cryobacterium]MDY7527776.1 DUF1206 domain-containing protein [Cryobacterium sp. 10C2]MEB0200195.1 DUF1206 domain-containing protein [Cryobacterium sp. 5I3]MEB0285097.1 DUF1206 domain-containing protein [Cryobacterium sp. 10S3]MEB0289084.1 DUF1206 domain-containing protein [Cryobacterium sp. 10C2]
MISNSAASVASTAKNSRTLQMLARLGFAVNGLLHILIAAIAIAIAVGAGSGSADQSGALGQLATSPGGVFVLWVVVAGLAALGLWLLLGAFLMRGADPKRQWSRRVTEVGKAVVYFLLAGTAFTFAQGGATSSAGSTRDASASLLAAPGGVIVLLAGGLLVLAIGVYFVRKGALQKFTADISVPSGSAGKFVLALGIVGYVAKGIVLAVVAVLIVVAAITVDPSQSTGLDGALRSLVALPYGGPILSALGAGLIAYGLYCFVRAWRARL